MFVRIVKVKESSRIKEEVAAVFCEVFCEKPWSDDPEPGEAMKDLNRQFKKPNALTLAAKRKGKVIGFAWMYELFKDDLGKEERHSLRLKQFFEGNKRIFYLQQLGVKKDFRRNGTGKHLVKKIIQKARARKGDTLILSTCIKAGAMISLLKKMGFQDTGIMRPPQKLERTYWTFQLKENLFP